MLQNYISKHSFPRMLGITMGAGTVLTNQSVEPDSVCAFVDHTAVSAENLYINQAMSSYYGSAFMPFAMGVSACLQVTPGTDGSFPMVYAYRSEQPRGASFDPAYPFSFSLYPIELSFAHNILSFRDVISIDPAQDPDNVVHYGLILSIPGGGALLGPAGASAVMTDGPIYQPNK